MKWITLFWTLLFPGIPSLFSQADQLLTIQQIEIHGNQQTKLWVIEQELTFQVGDRILSSFLPDQLDRSRDNIYNLGLFSDVRVSTRGEASGLRIIFEVFERFPIQGTPVLDFVERNAYDVFRAIRERRFTRLVYGGDVIWRNMTGGNETLALTLQGGFQQKLEVELFRPTFSRAMNLDLRLGVRLGRQKQIIIGTDAGKVRWFGGEQDFLQRRLQAYMEVSKRISLYQRMSIQLNFMRSRFSNQLYQADVAGTPRAYLSQKDGQEMYPSLILSYVLDRRDVKNFPLSGFKYQLFSRFSGPTPFSTTQFIKLGSAWAHHIPLKKRWNFAYGFHHVMTIGDSVPYFDQSFIGIYQKEFSGLSHELRGYDPYAIAGTSISMAKAELKFALVPYRIFRLPWRPLGNILDTSIGCYLTFFIDVGYVRDQNFTNQDPYFKDQLLYGYGPGLNIIGFYDMLVRIEYARNHLGTGGMYVNATVPIK